MFKFTALVASALISMGLASLFPAQPPGPDDPPPPKAKRKEDAKKKEEPGPRGDLGRAYGLLRQLRAADGAASRADDRLGDWIERAVRYYRDGLKAFDERDEFLAHEYGAIAHDLARAADHARKAALLDRRDPGLPAPPESDGPEEADARVRHDLRRAYDRIRESGVGTDAPAARVYVQASRDLYAAARQDAEAGRMERAGELARAAEAMTHVIDHLGHVADGPPDRREAPGRRDLFAPKAKAERRPGAELPPPLPPA